MQSSLLETPTLSQLSKGFPKRMAIVDLETTGGKATYHRVIEIGVLIVEDGQVVNVWHSMVNPRVVVPENITRITGIVPNDVQHAPYFEDIAQELYALIKDAVFVAHNARFDYGFLKNEFKRCEIKFTTKPLCSVKFSRALYPQFKRHSLDAIIRRFDLNVLDRHRATDDAKAVFDFFLKTSALVDEDDIVAACETLRATSSLPTQLDKAEVDRLPKSPGVYYFYNQKGDVLYIGKSVNVKARVMSHFSQDYNNTKDLKMSTQIAHIDFVTTPSDFGAQMLESHEIKTRFPTYNHRLRKVKKLYRFAIGENADGYKTVRVEQTEVDGNAEEIGLFRSQRQAIKCLETLADRYDLCHQLLHLEAVSPQSNKPCFRFQLKKCLGACCQKESPEDYNARLIESLAQYLIRTWPYQGAILLEEQPERTSADEETYPHYHLLNQWQYLAKLDHPDELYDHGYRIEEGSILNEASSNTSDEVGKMMPSFDLDTYFILSRFLLNDAMMKKNRLKVYSLIRH